MNPLKTDRIARRLARTDVDAKYPYPDEALMAPIDTKARIKRRRLFHLRAEISFAPSRYVPARRVGPAREKRADWAHFNEKR